MSPPSPSSTMCTHTRHRRKNKLSTPLLQDSGKSHACIDSGRIERRQVLAKLCPSVADRSPPCFGLVSRHLCTRSTFFVGENDGCRLVGRREGRGCGAGIGIVGVVGRDGLIWGREGTESLEGGSEPFGFFCSFAESCDLAAERLDVSVGVGEKGSESGGGRVVGRRRRRRHRWRRGIGIGDGSGGRLWGDRHGG